jgi:hypothetical protein
VKGQSESPRFEVRSSTFDVGRGSRFSRAKNAKDAKEGRLRLRQSGEWRVESVGTEKKPTAEARSTQRDFYFLPRGTGEDRGGGLPLRYGDNAAYSGRSVSSGHPESLVKTFGLLGISGCPE